MLHRTANEDGSRFTRKSLLMHSDVVGSSCGVRYGFFLPSETKVVRFIYREGSNVRGEWSSFHVYTQNSRLRKMHLFREGRGGGLKSRASFTEELFSRATKHDKTWHVFLSLLFICTHTHIPHTHGSACTRLNNLCRTDDMLERQRSPKVVWRYGRPTVSGTFEPCRTNHM